MTILSIRSVRSLLLSLCLLTLPVLTTHAQTTPPDAETEQTDEDDGGGWFDWLFGGSGDSQTQAEEDGQNYKTLTQDELNREFVKMTLKGKHDSMAQLLRLGANINSRDKQERTALIEMSRKGDLETARWLITRGASVNAKDMYDGTALIYATQEGNRDIVNLLIQNGARKN